MLYEVVLCGCMSVDYVVAYVVNGGCVACVCWHMLGDFCARSGELCGGVAWCGCNECFLVDAT